MASCSSHRESLPPRILRSPALARSGCVVFLLLSGGFILFVAGGIEALAVVAVAVSAWVVIVGGRG